MKHRPPTKLKEQESWWCDTCDDDKEMTYDEMIKHLAEKHGCVAGSVSGHSTILSHMDGPGWSSWQVLVTLDGKSGKIVLANTRMTQKWKEEEAAFDA